MGIEILQITKYLSFHVYIIQNHTYKTVDSMGCLHCYTFLNIQTEENKGS